MKHDLLRFIVCPECKSKLDLTESHENNGEIEIGNLVCSQCKKIYRVINYIPRFVETDEYVGNFSFEWDVHRETQIGKSVRHSAY